MSAIPEEFIKKTAELSEEVTRPFPNSRKVYVQGSRPDIRVPMREIEQSPTSASFGEEENPPVTVYDTSGPFTDPDMKVDLLKGMPDVRSTWIDERGDTETYAGREVRPEDDGYLSAVHAEKAMNRDDRNKLFGVNG